MLSEIVLSYYTCVYHKQTATASQQVKFWNSGNRKRKRKALNFPKLSHAPHYLYMYIHHTSPLFKSHLPHTVT